MWVLADVHLWNFRDLAVAVYFLPELGNFLSFKLGRKEEEGKHYSLGGTDTDILIYDVGKTN